MAKLLSEAEVRRYHEDGYAFPIRVMSAEAARGFRGHLEGYEAKAGGPLTKEMKHKTHLLFTWAADLVRHPRILDAIEDVIGPDILCWGSSFFIKEARDPGYVSWHQDLTYWGLDPADVVTAWLALSPSTVESGAMEVIPGSHLQEIQPHDDTFAQDNLLTRGQEIAVEVDQSRAVDITLQPGEISLHHVKLVHGSLPNRSDDRRIGFAVRYIPPHVRQVIGQGDSAALVRGNDPYHNFEPEPAPRADLDPEALAFHRTVMERQLKVLYRDTAAESFR